MEPLPHTLIKVLRGGITKGTAKIRYLVLERVRWNPPPHTLMIKVLREGGLPAEQLKLGI